MASVIAIISLVLYFGAITALIVWLVVRTNKMDKYTRKFHEDMMHYCEVLHADLNKDE